MSNFSGWLVSGSRCLSASQQQQLAALVPSLGISGGLLSGCCVGVDDFFIRSGLVSEVFAIFSASGSGAINLSAFRSVSAFASGGGVVHWRAGGVSANVSAVLRARTQAAVAASRGVLAFPAHSRSVGTWLAVQSAQRLGLPFRIIPLFEEVSGLF